ncbi:alpha/beta hydrolase [Alicyclobacillus dauci]|uniref:Alpha/beta hydrolase n=1 Tax=Alicyclobacillus dauci TaxID=1475485 RepID=A0ABY6Z8I1_9BACL|nr:alpha/beta hydrolase [Alicyclobacillus dauci]WAH38360.1 alpha/beta hydrolase [Alicyclobacillus dauci]
MDFVHKFIPSKNGDNKVTLVLLHGTGGNEDDLIPLGQFLSPDASLLGIRGKVLERGAPRYFRRLSEGVFDEEDLIFRTHELAQFIQEAAKTYSLRSDGLVAVGYSNGANIGASLMLLEPTVLKAAVLFRAMVPLALEKLPDLRGRKVLMQSGVLDPIIPAANSERLAKMLTQAGADVTLNWQNTGHGLSNPEFQIAKMWVHRLPS